MGDSKTSVPLICWGSAKFDVQYSILQVQFAHWNGSKFLVFWVAEEGPNCTAYSDSCFQQFSVEGQPGRHIDLTWAIDGFKTELCVQFIELQDRVFDTV